ncbi:MAG: ThuA domain-containing protein [Bacillota bacterium]
MKAIILQGGWQGHDPKPISQRFKKLLESEGFSVDVYDNLAKFAKVDLSGYALIVPLWTMAEHKKINSKVVNNVTKAVFAGAGIASCHGGIIDAFRQNTNWQFMTGAQWVYHGAQRDYVIKYDESNIFTDGLDEISVHSEQYYIHIDPCCKVYAHSDYPNGDEKTVGNGEYTMPAIYTKNYGKGKVFVTTFAHKNKEFDEQPQMLEIMRRGFMWAANEQVVPKKATFDEQKITASYNDNLKKVPRVEGKLNVGVVGCGNISKIYFKNLTTVFKNTNVVACCDMDEAKLKHAKDTYNIPKAYNNVDDILADKDIDVILNITFPKAHHDVCKRALLAGKHVYVEKPFSMSKEQGDELVALAKEKSLYIGGAPDTFLGAGIQTAKNAIDNNVIGKVVAGTAFMVSHGHESWHPSPEFYYEKGGGPLLDMGPYYITALVALLGKVKRVVAINKASFAERTITSKPKYGKKIPVETPTHISALLEFECGAVITLIMSFDVHAHHLPKLEVYGSEGSMTIPDPNTFGGEVTINMHGKKSKSILPSKRNTRVFDKITRVDGYSSNSRGLGLSNMINAILTKTEAQASGDLANHVLSVMMDILACE